MKLKLLWMNYKNDAFIKWNLVQLTINCTYHSCNILFKNGIYNCFPSVTFNPTKLGWDSIDIFVPVWIRGIKKICSSAGFWKYIYFFKNPNHCPIAKSRIMQEYEKKRGDLFFFPRGKNLVFLYFCIGT